MTVSIRSYVTAGMAATVVGAMAIAPVQPSAPTSLTVASVRLSAAVQPLVNEVAAAAATLGAPDVVATPAQPVAQKTAQANNNASNAIDAAYQWILYWGNYLALDLGPYLLGWIPFGYLISDQINIWYTNFTVPVANSFVYDFLDPVVNDFWNPAVWSAGLTTLARTTFTSLGTTINAEIAYVFSLAWFPIPLPPLPFAATKVAAGAASAAAAEKTTTTKPSGMAHSARPQMTTPADDSVAETTPATTPDADAVTSATPTVAKTTTTADKTTTTTGASRKTGTANSGADSGTKKSTGGSARPHGPKATKSSGD